VNAIRARDGKPEIDWKKEVESARTLFVVKTRGKRNYAVAQKRLLPYFNRIPLHSPVQFYVYAEEEKNKESAFYSCVATVQSDWKANESLAKMLYVSETVPGQFSFE
jgi:hypothetical protein